MASFRVSTLVSCLAMICMVVVASSPVAAAITCGQVVSSLSSCIPYVRGEGPLPPACCSGIKTLNSAAKTRDDRQQACNCLKTAVKSISGINYSLAAGVPGKCGVNIPYDISPSIDCSKFVHFLNYYLY